MGEERGTVCCRGRGGVTADDIVEYESLLLLLVLLRVYEELSEYSEEELVDGVGWRCFRRLGLDFDLDLDFLRSDLRLLGEAFCLRLLSDTLFLRLWFAEDCRRPRSLDTVSEDEEDEDLLLLLLLLVSLPLLFLLLLLLLLLLWCEVEEETLFSLLPLSLESGGGGGGGGALREADGGRSGEGAEPSYWDRRDIQEKLRSRPSLPRSLPNMERPYRLG